MHVVITSTIVSVIQLKLYILISSFLYILRVSFTPPLLVEGRHSFQVEMEAVSQFVPELSDVPLEERCLFVRFTDGNSISLFCNRGWLEKIVLWYKNYKFFRLLKRYSRLELNKLQTINTIRKKYKGTCVCDSVRFILLIHEQSCTKTVFIDDRGFMSEVCFSNGIWINGLGEGSYDQIKAKIDKGFEGMDVKYELYKFEDVMDWSYRFSSKLVN